MGADFAGDICFLVNFGEEWVGVRSVFDDENRGANGFLIRLKRIQRMLDKDRGHRFEKSRFLAHWLHRFQQHDGPF